MPMKIRINATDQLKTTVYTADELDEAVNNATLDACIASYDGALSIIRTRVNPVAVVSKRLEEFRRLKDGEK